MKKAIPFIMSTVLVFGMSTASAYAYGGMHHGYYNYNYSQNSNGSSTVDTQKLIDARKAYLDSLVQSGYITQEQADLDIQQYKDMLEYQTKQVEIDVDSLVKAEKAYLDSLVQSGYMTQEQADLRVSQYKSMLEYRKSNGYNYGMYGYGCGGYGHHGWGY